MGEGWGICQSAGRSAGTSSSTVSKSSIDRGVGKVAVEALLAEWLEQREGRVSETTLKTDRFLLPTEGQLAGTRRSEPVLPLWFRKLRVAKVNGSSIHKWQDDLSKRGFVATTVIRYQPEGSSLKAPKSGKGRELPIPDYLVPVMRRFAAGKQPGELLFTSSGGAMLYRTSFVRTASWEVTGCGRTFHDLRNTAACEWLIRGVPLTTVQAWLGHGSIQITARYLHHLGDYADRFSHREAHPLGVILG